MAEHKILDVETFINKLNGIDKFYIGQVSHDELIIILIKLTKKLFNIKDIRELTLENFEIISSYFNSFGFKIL